jgi:carbon dioxide concentrating mechanism protein CcmO
MVGAADAMLKSADVQLASYETIGAGLCTVIIRGSVANVAVAIEAGMVEAERIGQLNAVMIIPRLLEDLEHTLPVASYWLEEQQLLPVLLSSQVRQRKRKLVALPELEKVPLTIDIQPKVEQKAELESQDDIQ